MEWGRILTLDGDNSLSELLHDAYSAGWCDGYNAKGVEFDWIDEGFGEYLNKRLGPEPSKV